MGKKKKLDLKELLLEKGERIGLVVAVLLLLVLAAVGTVSALSNDSPGTTVAYIESKATVIDNKLRTGQPQNLEFQEFPDLSDNPVPLEQYVSKVDNFGNTGRSRDKRLNPSLANFKPVEFDAKLVRGQVLNNMFSIQRDQMMAYVLVPKEAKKEPVDPRLQQWVDTVKNQFGGKFPRDLPLPRGVNQQMVMQALGINAEPLEKYKLELVPIDRIPEGAKKAETVQPYRMAIISASVPYGMLINRYGDALNKLTYKALSEEPELLPRFLPFEVRRRALSPKGEVVEDWKALDYQKDFKSVVAYAADFESENPDMEPLVFPGLVFPRPKLTDRSDYPPLNLRKIDFTLANIQAKSGGKTEIKILNPIQKRIQGDIDIFAPRREEPKPKNDLQQPVEDPAKAPAKEVVVPEFCLLRFIDVTVEPGRTYQYQFRMRLANPNYGKTEEVAYPDLAKHEVLEAKEWAPEDPTQTQVSVSKEDYLYAVELDEETEALRRKQDPSLFNDPDVAFVQIHKWLLTTRLRPEQRNSEVPVGDWVVGNVPVRRGEFVGKLEHAEVPVWFPTREGFALPKIKDRRPPSKLFRRPPPKVGVPVDFSTRKVLVDWSGGEINAEFTIDQKTLWIMESANIELLVLSPDGKLRVHNSRVDQEDADRKKRYGELQTWVETVKAKENKITNPDDPFKNR